MLEESVDVMRRLWTGENVSHHGEHYTVENAKLFTLPEEPPDVYVSGTGPKSARKAGEFGDGLVSTAPVADLVDGFQEAGDGPRYGQATVCYADDEDEAVETALEYWPNTAMPGDVSWENPTPKHFEALAEDVEAEDITESVVCGADVDEHVEQIQQFADAGSTTSTSTRSVRTRRTSSSSTSRKCCRPSAEVAAGTTSSPERERGRCRRASIPT